jgi:hypothetical protein
VYAGHVAAGRDHRPRPEDAVRVPQADVANRRPRARLDPALAEVSAQPADRLARGRCRAEVAEEDLRPPPVDLVGREHTPGQESVPEEVPGHVALAPRDEAFARQRREEGWR